MPNKILDDLSFLEKVPQQGGQAPFVSPRGRLWAFLIDVFYVGISFMAIGVLWDLLLEDLFREILFMPYLFFMLPPLYKCWMEAKCGYTIGKHYVHIKVVSADNLGTISPKQAVGRNLLLIVFFLHVALEQYAIEYIHWGIIQGTIDIAGGGWIRTFIDYSKWAFLVYIVLYLLGNLLLLRKPHRALHDYWAGTTCIPLIR